MGDLCFGALNAKELGESCLSDTYNVSKPYKFVLTRYIKEASYSAHLLLNPTCILHYEYSVLTV